MAVVSLETGEAILLSNDPVSPLEGSVILTNRRIVQSGEERVSSILLEKIDSTSVSSSEDKKDFSKSIALAFFGVIGLATTFGSSDMSQAVRIGCGAFSGGLALGGVVVYLSWLGSRDKFRVTLFSGATALHFGPWPQENASAFHAQVTKAIDQYKRSVHAISVQQTVNVATGHAAIVAGTPMPAPRAEAPRLERPRTPRERLIEAARTKGGTVTRAEALGVLIGGAKENSEFLDNLVRSGEATFDVGPSGELLYTFPVVAESADSLDHKLLRVAEKRQGRLTATRAALDLGIPIARAEEALRNMVDNARVRSEMQPDGKLVFIFVELVD